MRNISQWWNGCAPRPSTPHFIVAQLDRDPAMSYISRSNRHRAAARSGFPKEELPRRLCVPSSRGSCFPGPPCHRGGKPPSDIGGFLFFSSGADTPPPQCNRVVHVGVEAWAWAVRTFPEQFIALCCWVLKTVKRSARIMPDDRQSGLDSYFIRESRNAIRSGIGRALQDRFPVSRQTPHQMLVLLMQLGSGEPEGDKSPPCKPPRREGTDGEDTESR
jgi:hypothetical protein